MRNPRTYELVCLTIPVAVQQKISEHYRDRNLQLSRELCLFFPVPDHLLLQDVLDRQNRHGENIGYCLVTRVVRNMIYCETAKGLQCMGAGN